MRLDRLRDNWDRLAREDPLWAVLTRPQFRHGRWDPDEFFATGAAEVSRIVRQLRRLRDLSVADALDFGCGTGRLTQALATEFLGATVIGVDISAGMVAAASDFARDRGWDRCRFRVNDRADLRIFADHSFDLVLSELTLLHMEPSYSLGYIREFLRVLRPDGLAVFAVPEPTRRQVLREALPRGLVSAGNRLRTVRRPLMEAHGVSRHDVDTTVRAAGGHLVGIYDRGREHGQFADLRYFVSPTPATGDDVIWVPLS